MYYALGCYSGNSISSVTHGYYDVMPLIVLMSTKLGSHPGEPPRGVTKV